LQTSLSNISGRKCGFTFIAQNIAGNYCAEGLQAGTGCSDPSKYRNPDFFLNFAYYFSILIQFINFINLIAGEGPILLLESELPVLIQPRP
jgi:hypothetical protein